MQSQQSPLLDVFCLQAKLLPGRYNLYGNSLEFQVKCMIKKNKIKEIVKRRDMERNFNEFINKTDFTQKRLSASSILGQNCNQPALKGLLFDPLNQTGSMEVLKNSVCFCFCCCFLQLACYQRLVICSSSSYNSSLFAKITTLFMPYVYDKERKGRLKERDQSLRSLFFRHPFTNSF